MDAKMFEDHRSQSQAPLLALPPTASSLCLAWETTKLYAAETASSHHVREEALWSHLQTSALPRGWVRAYSKCLLWYDKIALSQGKKMAMPPEQTAYLNRLIKAIKRHNPTSTTHTEFLGFHHGRTRQNSYKRPSVACHKNLLSQMLCSPKGKCGDAWDSWTPSYRIPCRVFKVL